MQHGQDVLNKHAKDTATNTLPMSSLGSVSNRDTEKPTSKIEKRTLSEQKNITVEIVKHKNSPLEQTAPNQQSSPILSEDSNSEKLSLVNLIDDSAKHLHGLMKGLTSDCPDKSVRLYDPDRVRAACQCASEIHKLLRLKLDVCKELGKING